MALDVFSCPECGVKLRRSSSLTPGVTVQCPKCQVKFRVPPVEEDAPPDPDAPLEDRPEPGYAAAPRGGADRGEFDRDRGSAGTRRADDEPKRPPLSYDDRKPEYDEDYDSDYPSARGRTPGELRNDYKVDLGQWFTLGMKHWGTFLGPFIGFALLFLLIYFVLIFVFPVLPFVLPHLAVGPYVVAMKILKGRPWTFGDFFGGFSWYGAILGATFLAGLIYLVCMTPYFAAYGYVVYTTVQAGPGAPPGPEILLVLMAGMALSIVPVTYFQVRYFWAMFLIIDRNYGAVEALRGSWKLTRNRFWITFAVLLFMQLINSVGASACYVGMLFSLPLTILITTAGYLLIAGSEPPISEDDERRRRFDDY
jgi:hypothetical protein